MLGDMRNGDKTAHLKLRVIRVKDKYDTNRIIKGNTHGKLNPTQLKEIAHKNTKS